MALTKRQKEFLDVLAGFLEKRGYSPSYEEIAEGLDLASLATVHKHILALETKEYVKRGFNQSRSLEVAPKYYEEQRQHRQMPARVEVPLLGRIAAGQPVEAIAGEDTLNFADFAGDPDTYALKVRGDSMIEDHICDGDYVLIEEASSARSWWRWWMASRLPSNASIVSLGTRCGYSPPMPQCSRSMCRRPRSAFKESCWRCCGSIDDHTPTPARHRQ
jgi:repressor LexA